MYCGKEQLRTIGPDVQNQILHRPLALGNLPVLHRDIGDHEVRVGPFGQQALVDLVEAARVRVHGLLLEVPDEAVGDFGGDEVRQEHAVEEDALGAEDHDFHEPARLRHLHERQEVHALVEALLEERLDPAVVALHAAQAAEVAEHAGDHARYYVTDIQSVLLFLTVCKAPFPMKGKERKEERKNGGKGGGLTSGNTLQKDEPHQPLRLGKRLIGHERRGGILLVDLLLGPETRGAVHEPPREPDKLPRRPVADGARLAVVRDNVVHLLFRVSRVRPRRRREADVFRLLGREEVAELCCSRCGEGASARGRGAGGGYMLLERGGGDAEAGEGGGGGGGGVVECCRGPGEMGCLFRRAESG